MRTTTAWAMALLAQACVGAGQDIETVTTTEGGAPDIAGLYDATLSDASGCDPAPPDVFTGPLEITGAADDLTWTFASGAAFSGQIDDAFSLSLGGVWSVDGGQLEVAGDGLAYIDAERWVLEVDLTMDASSDGGATCQQTGRLDAVENGGSK